MQNMLQYYIVNREKKPLCLEMHAVMKMADLTAFLSNQMNVHGFDDFVKF